jgi:hypothetical protein
MGKAGPENILLFKFLLQIERFFLLLGITFSHLDLGEIMRILTYKQIA